ncbi:hypothetical protein WMZ97_20870 [Lentibacillus sp. N15]|uniref:hypothetical protein n=1 Tax=Lentibacillus songyuanensis TaxID=3136161 RepID=UPI0031BA4983
MSAFRKSVIYIVIILVIAGIYHDLTDGTPVQSPKHEQKMGPQNKVTKQFQVVQVKVQAGDTVLSITEQLNESLATLNMEQIFDDFFMINHTNPRHIKNGTYYYFPLYK